MNSFLLLGFWLLGVSANSNQDLKHNQPSDGNEINWLNESLAALEKAITFFEKNYDQINLDGIFGLRVAQGQLQEALSFMTSLNDVPQDVRRKVMTLTLRAGRGADNALPYLHNRNRSYYQQFEDTISGPYEVPRQSRWAVDRGFSIKDRSPIYPEEVGDACFVQLAGNQVPQLLRQILGDTPPAPCTLSPACISMMLKDSEKKRGYALTHQLLFLIQAQRLGCKEASKYVIPDNESAATTATRNGIRIPLGVKQQLQSKTSDPQQYLCDQIYSELLHNVQQPEMEIYDIYQDLFLEQSVLCGVIGFENFLRPEWLRKVISWQSKDGCFPLKNEEIFMRKPHKGRKLLEEYELPDGCLSHKSGLGTALLGTYVRHLVEHGEELSYY